MAILAVQPSTPHLLVNRKNSYAISQTISPVEDCDILSPIVDSIPCIHENKENLELASYEERLVDAFCSGTLDAEVPCVIDDILALVQRLNLTHDGSDARETSTTSDAESAVSVARRAPLDDISWLHNDDGDQVQAAPRKGSDKSHPKSKQAPRKPSSVATRLSEESRRGSSVPSRAAERGSHVAARRGRSCAAPASAFR
ncbi:hypothetical protein CLOM_g14013 [Closterium sp. NIES-68]|nr:hypothetical protein CLOM_g12537 [Closterium sp. NIES-68]GJP53978.1 hypothetical protein CLOM_g13086 [Closterium sp. NIES-68]GJP54487.1 hypothetical protein CLOM_g13568 [Closterium sp. NIES-68]GJP54755.1 hypothetical protein CLOM_g13802 [Closterium sp. NIES-68]GJP55023.1 hypothetical protein CLOM_g14013 [Closterium sp. NIES-68]